MYLNIIILPLLGFLGSGIFGRYLGPKGCGFITTGTVGFCWLLSLFAFFEVGFGRCPTYITLFTWLSLDFLEIKWGFCFDSLTVTMLFIITSISVLVHIYSLEYMEDDPHLPRFMSYLSLFTFFMIILVTADNFIQMFVGWEGVGLCSFLLINFWHTRLQANKAAIKAMLVNRIGDFGLALAIFGVSDSFNALDYATVFSLVPYMSEVSFKFLSFDFKILDCIGLLLFVGASGKSAQVGLHTWLPDAMEGPTPVSALIHAATMVTAGVFLLSRCSPILEFCSKTLVVITTVGGLTAFFGATTALVQNDLKRVIAYSTCSQLGYMVFACGTSNYWVAIFHLANHAFFKALLFLGAGSVIHATGEQDLRKMGGLRKLLPVTNVAMVIGSFSLMGMPHLSGFYSKDFILEISYASLLNWAHFAFWLGSLSAFFTSFYSIRLLYLCFLSKANGDRTNVLSASEGGWCMTVPLIILIIPSIHSGYEFKDFFIGLGIQFWGNSLFILESHVIGVEIMSLSHYVKLFPVFLSILGAVLSLFFHSKYGRQILFDLKFNRIGHLVYTFFNRKWFFDKIFNDFLNQFFLYFGYNGIYKSMDRGLIESLGPSGITAVALEKSTHVRNLQSGFVFHYSLIFVLGSLFFSICLGEYFISAVIWDYSIPYLHLIFYNFPSPFNFLKNLYVFITELLFFFSYFNCDIVFFIKQIIYLISLLQEIWFSIWY